MIRYCEFIQNGIACQVVVDKVLFQGKTPYQNMTIVHTPAYGKVLLLDHSTQSAECDEHIYHESLVHPALLAHPHPKHVFIGGGGEGATLREVLKHPSVERVVMCDLDEMVVDCAKKHLPEWSQGAFDDPRVDMQIGDAIKFLTETKERFDVAIIDIADPLEDGPAAECYTAEFYANVKRALVSDGICVTQSGVANTVEASNTFTIVHNTLKHVFGSAFSYAVDVPSFQSVWGFCVASSNNAIEQYPLISASQVDVLIDQRKLGPLRLYDGETHVGLMHLAKWARVALAKETRINSTQNLQAVIVHE